MRRVINLSVPALPHGRRRALKKWATVAAGLGGAVFAQTAVAVPASASTTGSNIATVQVVMATVSLTVTPATSTFGDCVTNQSQPAPDPADLTLPNGLCNIGGQYDAPPYPGPGVTVTNGPSADQIDVNGGPALPSDNGTSWALTGQYSLPGPDQFSEYEADQNASEGYAVPATPECDRTFGTEASPSCDATAGESEDEDLWIVGPSSSTDTSSQFIITTTWTAVSTAQ